MLHLSNACEAPLTADLTSCAAIGKIFCFGGAFIATGEHNYG
jgi:hypothetical protein